jgi:hypothetical protein
LSTCAGTAISFRPVTGISSSTRFSLREWLRKENGTAENDVLLVSSSSVTALTQYAIEKDRARETGGFGGLLLQTGR